MKTDQNKICAQCKSSHPNLAVVDDTIKVEYDCNSPKRRASWISGAKAFNGLTEKQLNTLPLSCNRITDSCEFYLPKEDEKTNKWRT